MARSVPNASQLWSDHLEVNPAQARQDAPGLVALLTRRVRKALYDEEIRRDSAPLPPGANAIDIAWHAQAVYSKTTCMAPVDCVKAARKARKMFDHALTLDPNLVLAMTGRADTLNVTCPWIFGPIIPGRRLGWGRGDAAA